MISATMEPEKKSGFMRVKQLSPRRGGQKPRQKGERKMENELIKYLAKRYGTWESVNVIRDDGKTISLKIDFGDDEIMTVAIDRRNGYNGNYRVVTEG